MKVKINSFYEFPKELDLENFCNNPEENYKYKLKAVAIHVGGADYGHYYAIIEYEEGWLKFDDQKVSRFDISNLDSECFGNQNERDDNYMYQFDKLSNRNAYLLVYEKIEKDQFQFEDRKINYNEVNLDNNIGIFEEIKRDNMNFQMENLIFNDFFIKFINQLSKN